MYTVKSVFEKEAKEMRAIYCQTLQELARENDKIAVLDADLVGSSGMKAFFNEFPDRAVNCGIQENNMIGVAAGMSAAGMVPFAHSFGPFASRRCFDQLFLSAGYGKNDITVIGSDPGITAAFNGGTHMPFEDVALYRTIPTAIICDTTDVTMLRAFLFMAKDMPGVKFVRVGRKTSHPVYPEDTEFKVGKGFVLRDGTDATIIASGIMVHEALQAAIKLEAEGISVAVIDPFTIKPLDTELVLEYAKKTGAIVTAENHNKIGGLYSAVKEALDGEAKTGYVAIEDEFGEVGPQDYLRTRFDLTDDHIVRVVKETIAKKG